jgi:phosphoglycerol transferase MdoB-like AlkP superfamily enzyme
MLMANSLSNFRYYAARIGLLLLPIFCFVLLLAAKTQLFALAIGMASSTKQALPQYLGTFGALLLIFSFAVLPNGRWRWFWLLGADLLCSLVILLDLFFFRYFQDITTLRSLAVAWHYLNKETLWWRLLKPVDILLGADFLLLGGWLLWQRKRKARRGSAAIFKLEKADKYRWLIKLSLFVLLLLLGAGCCLQAYRLLEIDQPGITRSFYSKVYITQSVGEWEYRFLDIERMVQTRLPGDGQNLSQDQRASALAEWLRSEHPVSAPKDNMAPVAPGTNLIVIQLESWQEFVVGRTINGREITPNFNRLARNSLYFNNYYGETWSGGTSDAEFMSNCSLYPVSMGNAYMDYAGNNYVNLGKVLAEKGYRTVAMEADLPGFWNMDLMLRSEGFQQILDSDNFEHDLDIGMGLADHSMFRQAAAYLEQLPQPFYSFQVTLASHYPYLIPAEYKTLNVAPYQDLEFGHYLEAVHYADQALGTFLERLQADGLLEKSIVALYGDHQATFGRESQELRQFLGYGEVEMPYYSYLTLQKVPLLIHLPQAKQSGVIETVGGHTDLFPTLLGLLGEDPAVYPLLGHDLLDPANLGLAIARNGLLVTGEALLEMNQQKAFALPTGIPLAWEDLQAEQKRFQEYLTNTDLIMKYDLQEKIGKLLKAGK